MKRLLLTPAEVGEALGIGRTKVYRLLATGELPSIRIGSSIRVSEDTLIQWVVSRPELETSDGE